MTRTEHEVWSEMQRGKSAEGGRRVMEEERHLESRRLVVHFIQFS